MAEYLTTNTTQVYPYPMPEQSTSKQMTPKQLRKLANRLEKEEKEQRRLVKKYRKRTARNEANARVVEKSLVDIVENSSDDIARTTAAHELNQLRMLK